MPAQRVFRHRIGVFGGWMPGDKAVIRSWVAKKIKEAGDPSANADSWHSVIKEFRRLIEQVPELYKGFHEMFTEIPPDYATDPTGKPVLKDYMEMLNLFDSIIAQAPEWHNDPNNPGANDLVGFPINAILDWPMGTDAGYAMFVNPTVNAQFKKMFDVWTTYLTSPPSRSVLTTEDNGWFGPSASAAIPDFVETYECDPEADYYGFKSWDDFFTRLFRPNVREIAPDLMDRDDIVHSACESAVYRVANNVQALDQFWLKGQSYSLNHMLNNDCDYASVFAGGTVYQAFLSATKYHRWHAPVNGVVVKTVQVPGTYYAEAPSESFDAGNPDPSGPNNSQAFITAIAARALIFIRAKDPRIGLMCFIGVGMAEVSTCEITVKEGEAITKGQQIGMFHFGGSTHCLVFRPEANIQIDSRFIPSEDNPSPEVELKEVIASVNV
ncbi:hypothetical protein HGRIS_014596 [Hohenbuehelia grisea]|uniref:L-tryptophan decarboxylase PsiD-like domain-containing protein n=1 Tax=Hohenbuehelia grisea TaxID=104357 RepID=A0ABR3JVX4_9AGAR